MATDSRTESFNPANSENIEKPKSTRGRKKGQPIQKKERADLTNHLSGFGMVDEQSRVDVKKRREDFSDDQVEINKIVAANYLDWVSGGCSTNWVDMPVIAWEGPKDVAEDMLFKLRKAATIQGRKLALGNVEERTDGTVMIPFCVIARPQRKRRSDASDE